MATPKRDERQAVVGEWARRCFGDAAMTIDERIARFVEEAIELAQSVGFPAAGFERLIKYVYARPPGRIPQEIGGVGMTLLALCEVVELSADECEEVEFNRIMAIDPTHFRVRHNAKAAAGIAVAAPGDDHA